MSSLDSTRSTEASWTDCSSWEAHWEPVKKLLGGGQGDAFQARRKTDGLNAFVKTIRSKRAPERRARFFREASAYASFNVAGIPRFLESNAQHHKRLSFRPYLATEFVEGSTLREWRNARPAVDLATAINLTLSLLRLVSICHSAGLVHRDIKPNNIIVAGDDSQLIYLLDFGLSYQELPEVDFNTEHWQELGNRFLRLPELSAGSSLKQDPRSDLTFVVAILFYLLTARHPDILQDAEGRLPHQRDVVPRMLQGLAGSKFRQLSTVFDDAFDPQLANRIATVEDLSGRLESLMNADRHTDSPESDLAAILAVIDTSAERRRTELTSKLGQTLQKVHKVFQMVTEEFAGALIRGQSGWEVTTELARSTSFWTRPGSPEHVLSIDFEARHVGDELVVRISGETIVRTSDSSPDYGEAFRTRIRAWLLRSLRAAVQDSNPRSPEVRHFGELRPVTNIEEAHSQAVESGRRIMVFTYDPTLPERGRLDHALRHFLQNQKTRQTLADSFVLVLLPLSETQKFTSVLDGQSMENARWMIVDDQLQVLEQAVIYANPQVAEGVAAQLAEKYS